MFSPGWTEMIILGVIALLLFGKRLPEVARSLGQSFVEFKKGMTTMQTEMNDAIYSNPQTYQSNSTTTKTVEKQAPDVPMYQPPADEDDDDPPGSDEGIVDESETTPSS